MYKIQSTYLQQIAIGNAFAIQLKQESVILVEVTAAAADAQEMRVVGDDASGLGTAHVFFAARAVWPCRCG